MSQPHVNARLLRTHTYTIVKPLVILIHSNPHCNPHFNLHPSSSATSSIVTARALSLSPTPPGSLVSSAPPFSSPCSLESPAPSNPHVCPPTARSKSEEACLPTSPREGVGLDTSTVGVEDAGRPVPGHWGVMGRMSVSEDGAARDEGAESGPEAGPGAGPGSDWTLAVADGVAVVGVGI